MKLVAQVGAQEREIVVEALEEGRYRVVIDGRERTIDARRAGPGAWSLLAGDEVTNVDVDTGKEGELLVEVHGLTIPVKLVDPRRKLLEKVQLARPGSTGPTRVASPMPGKVVKILVKAGDEVAAGQGIVVVEAMKMENELRAPRAAKVAQIHVREGQTVEGQEMLLTLE